MIRQHTLRLPSGTVRGLQHGASVEPESAWRSATLHVPRLVSPFDAQSTALDITFDAVCRVLDVYTSDAMAELEMVPLQRAYALLEALCQRYVRDAVHALPASEVPAWFHKLLFAWAPFSRCRHLTTAFSLPMCAMHIRACGLRCSLRRRAVLALRMLWPALLRIKSCSSLVAR